MLKSGKEDKRCKYFWTYTEYKNLIVHINFLCLQKYICDRVKTLYDFYNIIYKYQYRMYMYDKNNINETIYKYSIEILKIYIYNNNNKNRIKVTVEFEIYSDNVVLLNNNGKKINYTNYTIFIINSEEDHNVLVKRI